MKRIRVALAAKACDVNIVGTNARCLELIAIGAPEIEMGFQAGPSVEPARQIRFGMAAGPERLDDLLAHLAATQPQRRADRNHEILRPAPELSCERFDGGGRNPVHRASPPRMHGGRNRQTPVPDQERGAVGDANDQCRRRIVTRHGISGRAQPRTVVAAPGQRDLTAMDLVEQSQAVSRHTGTGGHLRPVRLVVA